MTEDDKQILNELIRKVELLAFNSTKDTIEFKNELGKSFGSIKRFKQDSKLAIRKWEKAELVFDNKQEVKIDPYFLLISLHEGYINRNTFGGIIVGAIGFYLKNVIHNSGINGTIYYDFLVGLLLIGLGIYIWHFSQQSSKRIEYIKLLQHFENQRKE